MAEIHVSLNGDTPATLTVETETNEVVVDCLGDSIHFHGPADILEVLAAKLHRAVQR